MIVQIVNSAFICHAILSLFSKFNSQKWFQKMTTFGNNVNSLFCCRVLLNSWTDFDEIFSYCEIKKNTQISFVFVNEVSNFKCSKSVVSISNRIHKQGSRITNMNIVSQQCIFNILSTTSDKHSRNMKDSDMGVMHKYIQT